MKAKFIFWKNWLLIANGFTLLVGIMVAFAGNSLLFEWHNLGTLDTFFAGKELAPEVLRLKNWLFGIIGATIVGFHLLAIFIINNAFVKKEKWAWTALLAGLICWFAIDTAVSAYFQAFHNIYLINLFALFILGLPLVMTKNYFR